MLYKFTWFKFLLTSKTKISNWAPTRKDKAATRSHVLSTNSNFTCNFDHKFPFFWQLHSHNCHDFPLMTIALAFFISFAIVLDLLLSPNNHLDPTISPASTANLSFHVSFVLTKNGVSSATPCPWSLHFTFPTRRAHMIPISFQCQKLINFILQLLSKFQVPSIPPSKVASKSSPPNFNQTIVSGKFHIKMQRSTCGTSSNFRFGHTKSFQI